MDDPRQDARRARRARRAWIVAHHPDRGGDPQEFIAGLAQFAANGSTDEAAAIDWRPTVYRSRNPLRRALRMTRVVHRIVTGRPRSRRLL